jgi:hypothetical protein
VSFDRTLSLPVQLDPAAQGRIPDGVLFLPRAEREQPAIGFAQESHSLMEPGCPASGVML